MPLLPVRAIARFDGLGRRTGSGSGSEVWVKDGMSPGSVDLEDTLYASASGSESPAASASGSGSAAFLAERARAARSSWRWSESCLR